ncbi:hypothetical protein Sango_1882200 [Sesamum angolense]|uniref:Uncharacterized protein n=1 Tax=Sesamum angolense TaxID=2727404 RepID=A0AAE2BQK4_9LAMI|nr:hypothetical protein Sango_1882200 [Sesamum angolense]
MCSFCHGDNTTTLEEQIANLTRAREVLAKHVQEQDSQISKLMNKINNTDDHHVVGKQVEGQDEVETSLKQQSNERERSSIKELQVSSGGLIPIDQLKKFIMGTIQNKLDGSSRTFEELATRAHDMELSMVASGAERLPIQEPHKFKEKQEAKRGGKSFSKPPVKESMAVNTTLLRYERS